MDKVENRISELREKLEELILKKNTITDDEIVSLSQDLDKELNKYNELIFYKQKDTPK